MKRQFDPAELELMDRPQPVTAELEKDLRNLRGLNQYFGSYALVSYFMQRWIKPGDRWRVLDVATGSADIPRLMVDHARAVGAKIQIDALDRQPATLAIARKLSASYPEISFVEGDVLTWEPALTYDLVLSTLVLHHFTNEDAVRVLQRCRQFTQRFVLVSDLRRGLLASAGVWLLTALIFRDPMTKYDGRLSAARSFSFAEMAELARRAGWIDFGHRRFRFARQAIWMENAGSRF
jgi:SAM-dependent methyltransferase